MKKNHLLFELIQAGQVIVGIISLKLMFDSLRSSDKQQKMLNEIRLKLNQLNRN